MISIDPLLAISGVGLVTIHALAARRALPSPRDPGDAV